MQNEWITVSTESENTGSMYRDWAGAPTVFIKDQWTLLQYCFCFHGRWELNHKCVRISDGRQTETAWLHFMLLSSFSSCQIFVHASNAYRSTVSCSFHKGKVERTADYLLFWEKFSSVHWVQVRRTALIRPDWRPLKRDQSSQLWRASGNCC